MRDRYIPLERPAVFYCLALAVGLVVGDWLPGRPAVLLAGAVSAALLVRIWKGGPLRTTLSAAGVFVVLGYLSLQPWVAQLLPADHIRHRVDGPRGTITGRVAGLPYLSGNRARFLFQMETFNDQKACGKIRVSAVGTGPRIQSGDRLKFRAKVKSVRNFNNPGAFDYRRYLMFRNVRATTWVRSERIRRLEPDRPLSLKNRLARVRAGLSGWINAAVPTRAGSVLTALVTGDRSGIAPALRETFNRLGVGHLLAISGLHIGIVATVCFGWLYWLSRRTAWLVNRGRCRQAAALLTIFPVVAYGLLAGLSPATQRAVIMVIVFLLTIILDRHPDTLNALAVAGLVILVLRPPALFSVSFQLSFAAVFTIIYGLDCLPEKWRRPITAPADCRWPARLAESGATFGWVSFLAIAGTLPLSMHYFNQVSCVGLLANCIYIPVIGFVTVPLALAAVGLYPVAETLAEGVMQTAGFILNQALDLAASLSGFSWVAAHTVKLNWFEVVLAFGLLILGLRLIKIHRSGTVAFGTAAGPARPDRPSRLVWAGLAVLSLLLIGDAAFWIYQRYWHRDLRVTCIDVRQGSAALVEFPGGRTMLIDGGGYTDNAIFDMGARVVAPFLWGRKIRTVDILVLSHPNSDHLNGLLYIADRFKVGEIWSNGEKAATKGYRRFMEIVKRRRIVHPSYSKLPACRQIGAVTVTRLYPPSDFAARSVTETWRRSNHNSLVLRVVLDDVAFLFPGDLMKRSETELVRLAGGELRSHVLCVPHHGSKSSSSTAFIKAVKPRIAVISAGLGNRFRFPAKAVLERYAAAGSRVYRTDRDGAVMMRTEGGRLEVETVLKVID